MAENLRDLDLSSVPIFRITIEGEVYSKYWMRRKIFFHKGIKSIKIFCREYLCRIIVMVSIGIEQEYES